MTEPLQMPDDLTRERALGLLHQMLRVRRFEERCAELYQAEKIRGFLHLAIGEEAVCTGVAQALRPDDAVVATYREHGHAIVRGLSMRAVMAEMFGKQEGCARGRGGSMHLFDAKTRLYGGHAIVGGGLPIAVGLALADRLRKQDRVSACFFGDGAAAEGEFHESMNLAELWQLPVLFVMENNQYAMGTALGRSESEPDFTRHAAGYRVPAVSIDGMDVFAVEAAAQRAAAHIRAGNGPYFLECRTYRFRAHSMFDPQLYREKAEVDEWAKKGPIVRMLTTLRGRDWLPDEVLQQLEARVSAEIDDSVAFAEAGTLEPETDLMRNVYTEVAR
ncbi:MAG: pyruvate dehydrogenase (acetyl-transferring) E1 component subunit alpha [Planctomycetota bacterium]